jgi:hypothetical protein
MSASAAPASPSAGSRSRWALPTVVLAVIVVVVATVVGVRGLIADPIRSVAPDGTATITGTFEPVDCDSVCMQDCRGTCAQGFIQAGARSAFVRFPAGCSVPVRERSLTVIGHPATDLGKNAYRAAACASP